MPSAITWWNTKNQRRRVLDEAGDEGRRPQRPIGEKASGHEFSSNGKECAVVARHGAAHLVHMVGDLEGGVVDPDGPSAPERHRPEPLAESWDASDPMGERRPHDVEIKARVRRQDQHSTNLAGGWRRC
jgi:hypothetical protein